MKKFNFLLVFLLAIIVAISSFSAEAATKKKSKKKVKKTTQTASPYVIAIGYPSILAAYNAIQARSDVMVKQNAKPFGWQDRTGPWYVANEKPRYEWAFTQPGHYAHPSVVKRMIDVGSKDHVYLDMAFRCGASSADCAKLMTEFKDVNLLIKKVYQKKYIQTADGTPAWDGVDSLE